MVNNPSQSREVLMLQAFCYLVAQEFEKYAAVNKALLASNTEIQDYILANHVNLIIQLKAFGKLKDFTPEDFTEHKNFESTKGRLLTMSIATLLINGHSDELIEELKKLAETYKNDPVILGFIADALHFSGENAEAVKVFRTFLNYEEQSRELRYYITALYQTKKDSTELLQLLTKWRQNFQFHPDFLKAELQIRSELLEWKICSDICEYYLSEEPEDEYILVNYTISLYSENTPEANRKLSKLVPKLRKYEYKSLLHVSTVANVLIRRKYFDDGIELLYRYAKFKENVDLRKQYFTACVECSQGPKNEGPLKELDEAVEGAHVKYELDRKIFIIELTEENLKKEFYQAFLGAKKGGGIVVKRPVTEIEDVLSIQRVMNKYLSLHDEIMEQVHTDPHSGIGMTSITFEGGNIESLNETFKTLFGDKGSVTKINSEEELKRYYDLELTYSQIVHSVFNGDYLGGYFQLVLQQKGLTSIPLIFLKPIIPEDAEYVLDITSLAMMFQMFKLHQVAFDVKFILSKYIVDFLKKQLEEQNLESKSELSLSITKEEITPHFVHENQRDSNKTYLTGFLNWIESNCSIEISERVLDFTRNMEATPLEKPFIDYTLNTLLLVEDKENRILVTDDTQYLKSGLVPISKIVTSEFIAKKLLGEDHPALLEFLKNKYHGYTLTSKQLDVEYNKRLDSQPNSYDLCLENINLFRNPNSAIPAILHIKEMALNQLILPEHFKQDVTAVFVNLLRGIDPTIRNKIESLVKLQCALLGEKFDLIIASLREAYLILDAS
jgi:tetratricopeptide (TPR) repeat protein